MPERGLSRWLALPAGLLCLIPFVALVHATPWSTFHLAYGDWTAVATSLLLSAVAIVLVGLLGTPLAFWLARTRSRLGAWVHGLVLLTLLTPPLAMGILLASAYGPYSGIGTALAAVGASLNNNPAAFVLAQVYGGLPYFVVAARAAFEQVPRAQEEMATLLGASAWQSFYRVVAPQAAGGLASGLTIAWVRVIGEFGIVLVFAYFPQGMPVKLFVNLQNDGLDAVYALLWLLLLVTLPLPLWLLSASGRLRGNGVP